MATAMGKANRQVSDEAVFAQHELGAERNIVYFTPSAELLAKAFGAVPCEKPVPEEQFSLLIGDEIRAWDEHFPGYLAERKARREAERRGQVV